MKRLEQFAIENKFQLCTDTVLKFIEKTEPAEKQDSGKQSLLEQAKFELENMGFVSMTSNTFQSNNLKKEEGIVMMPTQES